MEDKLLTEKIKEKYIAIKIKLDKGQHITEKDIKDHKELIIKMRESKAINEEMYKIATFKELKESESKTLFFYYNYFTQLERDFYIAKKVRLHKNQKGANIILSLGVLLGIFTLFFNVEVAAVIVGIAIINDIVKRFFVTKRILNNSLIISTKEAEKQLEFVDGMLNKDSLIYLKGR